MVPESARPLRLLASCVVWLAANAPALAALDWESIQLERVAPPLATELEVLFPYRNAGPTPVVIREIQTNCECLDARASRLVVGAGESGVVRARFSVGERTGRVERIVTVVTDDGAPPRKLTLHVEIAPPARLAPVAVEWTRGSAPAERTVEVEVAPELDVRFATLEPTAPGFTTRLEEVRPGRTYRLHVRPESTAAPANAALRLHGRTADGRPVVVSAYANVR